jgi:DNA (cytosine-5)-methyltransferase 1
MSLTGCAHCVQDQRFLRQTHAPSLPQGPARTVRAVDLFSGAGGLSLGFAEGCRRAGVGFEVALTVDTDQASLDAFAANLPTISVRNSGVELLFDGTLGASLTKVERQVRRATGRVDVLLGGPPCQGVSSLNNHTRMRDPRNALYSRMARAAEVLQPKVVVVENVPGAAHDVAQVVATTIATLVAAGYEVRSSIVDLSTLGVPQRRKRLVIVGIKTDGNARLESLGPRVACNHIRTVRWAIEDLEGVDSAGYDRASTLTKRSRKRIDYLFDQDRFDLPNDLRPACHMRDHSYLSMYGRLHWDKPAQTITSGFSSMGQGRFVHPSQRRTLTAHEAARLQTFPDFYVFPTGITRTQRAELIANAVPPLANIAMAEYILGSVRKSPHGGDETSEAA